MRFPFVQHRGKVITVSLALLAAVFALLLLLPDGDDEASSPLAPIAAAAERTAAYPGARISIESEISGPQFPEPLQMRGTGAFNGQTDRFEMTMRAVSGPPTLDLDLADQELVGEGHQLYMRGPSIADGLPDGATWLGMDSSALQSEQSAATASNDPRAMLEQLKSMSDVTRLGTEEVRGEPTTHYGGSFDPAIEVERLRAEGDDEKADQLQTILESNGSAENPTDLGVWVDDRGLVRRMSIELPFELIGGPGSRMAMTIEYFDFGVEPEIDLPAEEDVFDGTELGVEAAQALAE